MFSGLLERPPLSPHVEEASYKLFIAGKSGVGKTATVTKLTGNELPKTHCETPGNITGNKLGGNLGKIQ